MLRKDKHTGVRILRTDLPGRAKSFVRMGRRHPDVDQSDLRAEVTDTAKQRVCISNLTDDVYAVVREQPGNALSHKRCVVGDYDSHRKQVHTVVPRPASLSIDI